MRNLTNTRNLLLGFAIAICAISLLQIPGVYAAGISIQYGNSHHGISVGHRSKHGAVGHITSKKHSRRHSSHHKSSNYNRRHHYRNNNYSYPAYYSYYSPSYSRYSRYSSFNSPSQYYYNRGYSGSYRSSSYPISYRGHSSYQQYDPRHYGNQYYSGDPWSALVQGQTHLALSQFGSEAQAYPQAGVPKIGYALAAAASGDLKQGVVAMRRAFKIDPHSLNNYRFNQNMQPLVNNLLGLYQYKLSHRGRHRDEAFMIAALSYLNGNQAEAQHSLERARHDGDRSRSFKNLRDFLKESDYPTKGTISRNY